MKQGESQRLADADFTVFFETVLEDSRCPKGANCVWAGDATVRIRIEAPGVPAVTHTLHTNDGFQREVIQGNWRIQLSSLMPEPTTDGPPRSDEYRATLLIQRK